MIDKEFETLEKRLLDKCLEGKCPVCGSGIVKDFKDAIHDRVCQECLDDMKELTSDFNEPLPKWIIMDPEVVRKTLIMKHFKHDFPNQYNKLEQDFLNKRDILDNLITQDFKERYKNDFQEFDNKKIMKLYRELKLEHPEWSERELLKMVFSTISKDSTSKQQKENPIK